MKSSSFILCVLPTPSPILHSGNCAICSLNDLLKVLQGLPEWHKQHKGSCLQALSSTHKTNFPPHHTHLQVTTCTYKALFFVTLQPNYGNDFSHFGNAVASGVEGRSHSAPEVLVALRRGSEEPFLQLELQGEFYVSSTVICSGL